ncbi:MAG: elongation factor P, partial [Pirellulaceae bacterium]|nr:elongation factor P [Pirellulaceae bacterium]
TGAEFICPAFIEIGNVIRIDTRTGDYVERARTK